MGLSRDFYLRIWLHGGRGAIARDDAWGNDVPKRGTVTRQAVTSSNVAAIGYAAGVLHIEFASGAVHAYYDVPADDHADLIAAPSIGQHYARHIRGQFRTEKIQAATPRPVRGFDALKESHAEIESS